MQPLNIESTDKSLGIDLKPGVLNFSGCSIVNDPKQFFTPIQEWIDDYITSDTMDTEVNIKIEYMDTASVKTFYEILKKLTNINKDQKLVVNWHYEYDDPEILELGEILQSKLDFEFLFHEYNEEDED